MAKTIADVEKKIGILDETEEAPKGRNWKWLVITPLALVTVVGGAFLVVRRRFGQHEQ